MEYSTNVAARVVKQRSSGSGVGVWTESGSNVCIVLWTVDEDDDDDGGCGGWSCPLDIDGESFSLIGDNGMRTLDDGPASASSRFCWRRREKCTPWFRRMSFRLID